MSQLALLVRQVEGFLPADEFAGSGQKPVLDLAHIARYLQVGSSAILRDIPDVELEGASKGCSASIHLPDGYTVKFHSKRER